MPIDANTLIPSLWGTLQQPAPTNTWPLGSPQLAWSNLYLGAGGSPVLDGFGNIGYYNKTGSESSATVTPVNLFYPPGVVDRYQTNTTPGTTDMHTGIAAAAAVNAQGGPPVTFLGEKYLINTNTTVNAPVVFGGAVITLGTPTTVFGGIQNPAGLQPENFGAKGNGTASDATALQTCLWVCANSGYIPMILLPKRYLLGTGATQLTGCFPTINAFNCVPVYGSAGVYTGPMTILDGTGAFSSLTAILLYNAQSPGNAGVQVRDIQFTGDANCIGLEWRGTTKQRAVRCTFSVLAEGIRWNDATAGQFTEFCMADDCLFEQVCTLKGHYVMGAGTGSFHGSGLTNRCMIAHNGNMFQPIFAIDNNALPYNAPFDCTVFCTQSTILFNNANSAGTNVCFIGGLTIEVDGGTLQLGHGNQMSFDGPISSNSNWVYSGSLVRAKASLMNSGGAIALMGAEYSATQAIISGANTIASQAPIFQMPRKLKIIFQAANYLFTYDLTVFPAAGSTGVTTIANTFANNGAAYGAPIFTGAASGQLIATQAGWPAGATFTGSIAGNTLTVSGVTGTIAIGQSVSGPGIPSGMTITAGSGTTWTINGGSAGGFATLSATAMTASIVTCTYYEVTDYPGVFAGAVGYL